MSHAAGESLAVKKFEISHKSVFAIAIPTTLAYLTTPLLGMTDTAVVGRFGDAALIGGLAVGAIIIDLVFTTFNFLRAGTTGLTSQAYGAEDDKEKQAVLFRALAIAIGAGIVLALLSPLILWLGLWAMQPSEAVAQATSTYFLIRMLSAPFALGNYVILGWLIGIERSKTMLGIQLLLNGTNISLSFALGLWLGWGIEGVAIATVIGEVLAFCVGGFICWGLVAASERPSRVRFLDSTAWKRLLNLNSDIMIRSFSLVFAFSYFTAQSVQFGEVTLAANAILMHLFILGAYFLDGMVTAVEQIVGRTIGANYREGFWKAIKLTFFWCSIMAIACAAFFWFGGTLLISAMTTLAEVREEAHIYLIWAALVPIASILAFQMDGIFIGATWSRDMSIMMIVSLIGYLVVWKLVEDPLGNHGLWLALHAFVMLRGLTLALRLPARAKSAFPN